MCGKEGERAVGKWGLLLPPAKGLRVEADHVEGAVDDGVDEGVKIGGAGVERGGGGHDDASGTGDGGHVVQMDEAEGGIANDADELAAFLQDHVGGTGDEVVGDAVGDATQGAHAAWDDDHVVVAGGAGCKGGKKVAPVIDGKRDLGLLREFLLPDGGGVFAHDDADFHIRKLGEVVEEAFGVYAAAGSSDGDNDLFGSAHGGGKIGLFGD